MTGASPGSIGETTALAIARAGPALLILASRTASKLDAVAEGCRGVVAKVSEEQGRKKQEKCALIKAAVPWRILPFPSLDGT